MRVLSCANFFLLIGVRIHALVASKAKANRVFCGRSGRIVTRCFLGPQAQERHGEQVSDFLMGMAWPIGVHAEDGFVVVHGQRSS